MTDPKSKPGVLLWERGTICCTCHYRPTDEIEIVLTVNGKDLERVLFIDAAAAANYAIAKMHVYECTNRPSGSKSNT